MKVTEPIQLVEGLTAKPTRRDIVVADLHYSADPGAFPPEVLDREKRRQGCVQMEDGSWKTSWKWQKEMELDWTAQAGRPVFDAAWLDAQRPSLCNPEVTLGYEIVTEGNKRRAKLSPTSGGPIKVYLDPRSQPEGLSPETAAVRRNFGLGLDVGEGVGASDSTIQVFTSDTWEQAAEFASNTIKPSDLGRVARSLATWFNDGLICCVRKMHGITTLRAILDEGYPYLWRDKVLDRTVEYDAKNFGWAKGESSSPALFGRWMDALQYNRVKLHSVITLDQHRQYIYDESGRITHQQLAHLSPDVRHRHGDLVIACALALRSCMDMANFKKARMVDQAPPGSMAWRTQQFKLREKRKADRWA